MVKILGSIFPWILGGLGVLLVYASFSYEDEEGKIQSRLEEWWIRIDDFKRQALSSHIAFMKVLASVLTSFLDRLFGVRLFSLQSFGVSMCYSIFWLGIFLMIAVKLNPTPETADVHALNIAGFGLLFGTIPALMGKTSWNFIGIRFIHIWFVALLYVSFENFFLPFGYIVLFALVQPGMEKGAFLFTAIIIGVVFAVFLFATFICIMRSTTKAIAHSTNPMKIIGLTILNAVPVVIFYGLFKLFIFIAHSSDRVAMIMSFLAFIIICCGIMLNLAFILSAALFVCLAVVLLLHHLFWPLIQRPLYKLQALGVAKRPLLFRFIGLTLIGLAFGKHEWLWSIIAKL
jgi:hypothetical protein